MGLQNILKISLIRRKKIVMNMFFSMLNEVESYNVLE
jgi:hypothetical protein